MSLAPKGDDHVAAPSALTPAGGNGSAERPGETVSSTLRQGAFVPRAVKRRPPTLAAARRPVLSTPSTQTVTVTSATRPVVSTPLEPAAPPRPAPHEVQRLEQVLVALESSLSDHGLTCHRSSGLLDKLKSGTEWIHLSQVLGLAPVRALTSALVDLKNAVALRESDVLRVDATGYQIARKGSHRSIAQLETFDVAEWDDLTLHLENIPFNTSLNAIQPARPTSFSLVRFLSAALDTRIEKLLLPALYDPKNPPNLEDEEGDDEENDGNSQSEAFRASMRARHAQEGPATSGTHLEAEGGRSSTRPAKGLPRGGGLFKGFAFVVLSDRTEVEKVLGAFPRNGECCEAGDTAIGGDALRGLGTTDRGTDIAAAHIESDDEEEGIEEDGIEGGDETMQVDQEDTASAKGKRRRKSESTCREKAKRGGLKAMPYAGWLDLKKEYLAYRRTIERLLEAQASGDLDLVRNPPDAKDQPPHLRESNVPTRESTSSSLAALGGVERTSSPPSDAHALDRSSLSSSAPRKRAKRERASSPSVAQANALLGAATTLPRHTRKLRTPSPLPPSTTGDGVLDLSSDVALSIQGAYPQGCVLWVRNVHEKSSKTSLKSLFGKLLDDLQEGSGKGVEFVDYEKGLETCYIRFSSAPLAALTENHLLSTITYNLSQQTLSPVDTLSEAELTKAQVQDLRRPLAVELLRGERERQYWASLPESTRKAARLGAGGKVGLVKEPRGFVGESRDANAGQQQASGAGTGGTSASGSNGSNRKRKKPSRM